ncbi:MAG: flagellar basal body L-ring protein FlgH [Nitrospirota bacterium]|nr:flagellar basal body L-ring protein FlgH [Nitrospirota bacterium]MDH5573926.1 flagellar basal body L-ring protein FlgH [Nitrospirota bacterium]
MRTPTFMARLGVWGVILLVIMSSWTGCALPKKATQVETDPIVFEKDQPSSLGSLWDPGNGRAFMFEDRRASRVGDIVVVQIVEQHKGSKKANTKADREASLSAGVSGGLFGISSLMEKFAEYFNVDAGTSNAFEGDGSTSREDTLTGTIAAKVIEVFPNGDLRIQGKREVTVNSEKQTMIIKGIVRRIDLDTQNMVLSSAVADAEIAYTGLGVVDDVQRPGWATRIFDWITPF